MAETTSGLRSILSLPLVYRLFQKLLGAKTPMRTVVADYIRPAPGATILDVGCGPADYFAEMSNTHYTGFDHSAAYIAAARSRYGDRGRFFVGDAISADIPEPKCFDIVLATGLIHHLDDDQARALYRNIQKRLAPKGRMITVDPALVKGQSPVARYLIQRDRGHHVREVEAYRALALTAFPSVTAHVRHDLLRIPYTHCILECQAGV